jgi:hypothetical protein
MTYLFLEVNHGMAAYIDAASDVKEPHLALHHLRTFNQKWALSNFQHWNLFFTTPGKKVLSTDRKVQILSSPSEERRNLSTFHEESLLQKKTFPRLLNLS